MSPVARQNYELGTQWRHGFTGLGLPFLPN